MEEKKNVTTSAVPPLDTMFHVSIPYIICSIWWSWRQKNKYLRKRITTSSSYSCSSGFLNHRDLLSYRPYKTKSKSKGKSAAKTIVAIVNSLPVFFVLFYYYYYCYLFFFFCYCLVWYSLRWTIPFVYIYISTYRYSVRSNGEFKKKNRISTIFAGFIKYTPKNNVPTY